MHMNVGCQKTRQPPVARLEIDFSIDKKVLAFFGPKNVDTSTWAKKLIRRIND